MVEIRVEGKRVAISNGKVWTHLKAEYPDTVADRLKSMFELKYRTVEELNQMKIEIENEIIKRQGKVLEFQNKVPESKE